MPIRTHRGRSAVYRQLWGWPLRSGRHLVVAVLALVAVGVAVAVALPDGSGSGASTGRAASERAGTGAGSDAPDGATPARPYAPPAALDAARAWAQAWVTHPEGITSEQWTEQLRPYTTADYLPQLRSVDPANVPADAVTGNPLPVSASGGSIMVDVPTNGAVLRLRMVRGVQGWLVDGYEQAG